MTDITTTKTNEHDDVNMSTVVRHNTLSMREIVMKLEDTIRYII